MDAARAWIDLMPCSAVRIGADRRVRRANRHALDLLSCTSVDLVVGRDVGELVSVASRILLDSYVYPMLLEQGVAEEIQLTLKSSSGEARPVVANFRMHADRTVDWAFMGCANRDQLYTELLDTRDTLQQHTTTLGRLNDRIRERQSDLQAFCHSLSHDFTGPLLQIHQFVDFALEDLRASGLEAPDELRYLENARRSAAVLLGLTKGLVDYLVADLPAPHDERVDLEEIVSTVLAMRESPGATAPLVHRDALPTVIGSRSQLHILFKNLLENAIKYNERDPEITIRHQEDVVGARITIAIEDNGIGMSEEHLDKVFDPFTRLDTGDRYQGSGLGLSIVRKMVVNHGGDIRVQSTPGVGSTFHVTLLLDASRAHHVIDGCRG